MTGTMLFQADNILKDAIATLRAENSQLMVEINEIKNDVGLREDQVGDCIGLSHNPSTYMIIVNCTVNYY